MPHKTTPLTVRFVMPRGWTEPLAVFMGAMAQCRRWNGQNLRMSYMHTGQHGECTDNFLRARRATVEQYTPLLKELESLGYSVTVK